jgi:hypothetical protein
MKDTRIELSCPSCGKSLVVECDEPFFVKTYMENYAGYKVKQVDSIKHRYNGQCLCECGYRVIADLEISAIRIGDEDA